MELERRRRAVLLVEEEDDRLFGRPVRADGAIAECARLVLGGQADPQVPVLLAHGKAGEEPRAHEVAPAPEHGRDLHARPPRQGLVQVVGGPGPAPRERTPRPAPAAETAEASDYGQTCMYAKRARSLTAPNAASYSALSCLKCGDSMSRRNVASSCSS